jgi:hypothetical protein
LIIHWYDGAFPPPAIFAVKDTGVPGHTTGTVPKAALMLIPVTVTGCTVITTEFAFTVGEGSAHAALDVILRLIMSPEVRELFEYTDV